MCLRPGTELVWNTLQPNLSPAGYRIGVESGTTKTVSDRVQNWYGRLLPQICPRPGTDLVWNAVPPNLTRGGTEWVWKARTHNLCPTGYRIGVERCTNKTGSDRVQNWCGTHSHQICLRPGTELVWNSLPPNLSPTG